MPPFWVHSRYGKIVLRSPYFGDILLLIIQYIVIDGNSTDKTLDIVKKFKNKKIGLLYSLNEDELINTINNYDISFIMPHQLNFFKSKKFDLTIAIDCIHEMDKETIKKYFYNINRFSKLFYFSVAKKTSVPFSGILRRHSNNLNYFSDDYQIPKNWEKIYEKDLIFPSNHISSGYQIK